MYKNIDRVPSLKEERRLAKSGYRFIAGVDEVGRGALAGPVAAGAVILPQDLEEDWLKLVRDSKLLSANQRVQLDQSIKQAALAFGIGMASSQYIDMYGIVPATRLAMQEAIKSLRKTPDHLLIDAIKLPSVRLPQESIIHGDRLCVSIACASIIAKVARDRLMVDIDKEYPGYGFARHKGYGTRVHLEYLKDLGPSPVHRKSFSPVRALLRPEPEAKRESFGLASLF